MAGCAWAGARGGGVAKRSAEMGSACWKQGEFVPLKVVQGVPWSWASPTAVVSSDVQPGLRERGPSPILWHFPTFGLHFLIHFCASRKLLVESVDHEIFSLGTPATKKGPCHPRSTSNGRIGLYVVDFIELDLHDCITLHVIIL